LGHENIARFQNATQDGRDLTGVINKNGVNSAALADAAAETTTIRTGNWILTR